MPFAKPGKHSQIRYLQIKSLQQVICIQEYQYLNNNMIKCIMNVNTCIEVYLAVHTTLAHWYS